MSSSVRSSSRRWKVQEEHGPPPPPLRRAPLMVDRKIQKKQPVIIYMVSPKVIHAKPSEFMALVQRLTGNSSTSSSPVQSSSDKQDGPFSPSHGRQFPVRVKARPLALSCSYSDQNPKSFPLMNDVLISTPPQISYGGDHREEDHVAVASDQKWFLHGGGQSESYPSIRVCNWIL